MNDVSSRRSFPKSNALQDEDVKTTRSGRPFLCPETGRSNMVPSGEHVKPASTVKNRPGGRKLCSIATSLGGGFREEAAVEGSDKEYDCPTCGEDDKAGKKHAAQMSGRIFFGREMYLSKKNYAVLKDVSPVQTLCWYK